MDKTIKIKAVFTDKQKGTTIEAYPTQMATNVNENTRASTTQLSFLFKDYSTLKSVATGWECDVYYINGVNQTYQHLQTYICNSVDLQATNNKTSVVISSIDYSHFILSFLASKKQVNETFVDIIRFFIEELNFKNKYSGLTKLSLVEYPVTKSDGSPFPVVEYFAFQKDLKTVLDELTTNKYTDDGNYDWWVDSYGGVHIVKSGSQPTLDLSNAKIKSFSYRKGIDVPVNQVIIYAGKDLNGAPMYDTVYDTVSIAMYGLHDRLEIYKSYRDEIWDLHKNDNPPIDNNTFKDLVLSRAREKAMDLINSKSKSVPSMELVAYNVVADVYTKTVLPSWLGITDELLTKKVTYTINHNGWLTKLALADRSVLKYA